jgi:hypothetical protein
MERIFLLQEDGGKLLQESSNGNNNRILLDIIMSKGVAIMRSLQNTFPLAMDDQRVL